VPGVDVSAIPQTTDQLCITSRPNKLRTRMYESTSLSI